MGRPETEAYSYLLGAESDLMDALDALKRIPNPPDEHRMYQLARAIDEGGLALSTLRDALAATAALRVIAADSIPQEGS